MQQLALAWMQPTRANAGRDSAPDTWQPSFDYLIDGTALHPRTKAIAHDCIGALGWLPAPVNQQYLDQLTLRSNSPMPSGRRLLYVCPVCGDPSCGAITCDIVRDGATVVWQRFGYENNYDDAMADVDTLADLGPFRFAWDGYLDAFALASSVAAG